MFSSYVVDVLQQLGYISLIVIAPCTLYNTIKLIKLDMVVSYHIDLDEKKFVDMSKHLGKHDSQIDDLRISKRDAFMSHIDSLVNK